MRPTCSSNLFSWLATTVTLVAAQAEPGQIVPQTFALPTSTNNTQLGVAFDQTDGQTIPVQPGQLFGANITKKQPNVAIDGKNSSLMAQLSDASTPLLLVMVDPDAPTPEGPTASAILHWMAPNMKATTAPQDFGALKGQSVLANSTPNVVPYAPPGPPATSSAHRYLLYLFEQPSADFQVPAAFSQFSATSRANFDLAAFMAAAQLKEPVAANFMYVSSQQAVPATFQGAPFSEFPGGNGNAIGLPGSTAGAPTGGAGAGNNSTGTPAAPAAPPSSPPTNGTTNENGSGTGAANGATTMGQGTIQADGSCFCSATCPAGSLTQIMVQTG